MPKTFFFDIIYVEVALSFLDYILKGFGIQEIKPEVPQKKMSKNSQNILKKEKLSERKTATSHHAVQPIDSHSKKLAIFCPTSIDEVIEVAKFISTNQPTMLNISMLDKSLAQRSMDFILGAKTAAGASMECVGKGLYIFAPKGTKMINRTKSYEN